MIDTKKIEKNIVVEDHHILLGLPLLITKYGKEIEIKQVLWKKWEQFTGYMVMFLNHYYVLCNHASLPDNLNDIEEFRNNIRTAISFDKRAFKCLQKICGFNKVTSRFMKNNFTIDDYVEVFIYTYLYNIKGVKSSCNDALKAMRVA